MKDNFRSRVEHYFDLVAYKTYADLKSEAVRTYVNYLWWIIDPLFLLASYYLAFGILLQTGGPGFIFVLFSGLVFWNWYSKSLSHAAETISSNKGLMNQIDVRKWVFPLICVLTDSTKFLFTLIVLLVSLLIWGDGVRMTWLVLPLLIFAQAVLILGMSMFVASVVPFVPDMKNVINTLLLAQMFVSGVFFASSTFPDEYRDAFFINPMARLINEYREILLHGNWPNWGGVCYVLAFGGIFLFAGLVLIEKFDKIYPRLN